MAVRVKYSIMATCEGDIAEVLVARVPSAPTLTDVINCLGGLAFIVETVAHLQGKERELLPYAENARKIIEALTNKEV